MGAIGAGFLPGKLGGVHGGFDLQRVLAGLDQEGVDAAGDQAAALLGDGGFERVVGDVAERWQLRARADAAKDVAVAAIGEGFGSLPRQFGRNLVDLVGAVLEAELAEGDGAAAERVGLDHIGAGFEITAMDFTHEVRAGQVQHFRAVLLVPIVPLDIQGQGLHAAAHSAIAEQNLVMERLQEVRSGH